MKKKVAALLIAISSAFISVGFASCELANWEPGKHLVNVTENKHTVDLSEFNSVVAYRSAFNYDAIKIKYSQLLNGAPFYEAVIEFTEDMLVSGGETDKVGEHELVLSYEGEEFVVPYTVKYQVDFVAQGEIFATQYVLTKDEIVYPETTPDIKGYEFGYWTPELPETLTDNLSIEAYYYKTTLPRPKLEEIEVVYNPTAT